jgi:hypothetical protein
MPAASRTFTPEDQSAFAALAGDFNPIHVDALAARRLLFGTPVVHGIHLVLWALESSWPSPAGPARLARLEATFRQPVRVGFLATCEWDAGPGGSVRITSQDRLAAEVRYRTEAGSGDSGPPSNWPLPRRRASSVLGFAEARGAHGEMPLAYSPNEMAARFPVSSALPAWQLAVLLATSRLVGVECPGLRALFTSLDLAFRLPEAAPLAMRYEVVKADERLSSLRIHVAAPGVDGELGTRLRPDPVEQPSLAHLARLVDRGEFAGTRALVIGGSRGLGEVAAKLLAAGGGQVRLTYHVGAAEAARVVEEIRAAGGEARAFACDVLGRSADAGLLDGWRPTHLLYFPTPFISLNESTAFSVELFRLYCRYYVEGLAWILESAAAGPSGPLAVFYPSSSVLDEVLPKAAEYGAAKAAGEAACSHLCRLHAGMRCHAPRLPRVLTDRTASILSAETADPGPLLLRELRRMNAGG